MGDVVVVDEKDGGAPLGIVTDRDILGRYMDRLSRLADVQRFQERVTVR